MTDYKYICMDIGYDKINIHSCDDKPDEQINTSYLKYSFDFIKGSTIIDFDNKLFEIKEKVLDDDECNMSTVESKRIIFYLSINKIVDKYGKRIYLIVSSIDDNDCVILKQICDNFHVSMIFVPQTITSILQYIYDVRTNSEISIHDKYLYIDFNCVNNDKLLMFTTSMKNNSINIDKIKCTNIDNPYLFKYLLICICFYKCIPYNNIEELFDNKQNKLEVELTEDQIKCCIEKIKNIKTQSKLIKLLSECYKKGGKQIQVDKIYPIFNKKINNYYNTQFNVNLHSYEFNVLLDKYVNKYIYKFTITANEIKIILNCLYSEIFEKTLKNITNKNEKLKIVLCPKTYKSVIDYLIKSSEFEYESIYTALSDKNKFEGCCDVVIGMLNYKNTKSFLGNIFINELIQHDRYEIVSDGKTYKFPETDTMTISNELTLAQPINANIKPTIIDIATNRKFTFEPINGIVVGFSTPIGFTSFIPGSHYEEFGINVLQYAIIKTKDGIIRQPINESFNDNTIKFDELKQEYQNSIDLVEDVLNHDKLINILEIIISCASFNEQIYKQINDKFKDKNIYITNEYDKLINYDITKFKSLNNYELINNLKVIISLVKNKKTKDNNEVASRISDFENLQKNMLINILKKFIAAKGQYKSFCDEINNMFKNKFGFENDIYYTKDDKPYYTVDEFETSSNDELIGYLKVIISTKNELNKDKYIQNNIEKFNKLKEILKPKSK